MAASANDINAFLNINGGDPYAVADAMRGTNTGLRDIISAGRTPQEINAWLGANNLSNGYFMGAGSDPTNLLRGPGGDVTNQQIHDFVNNANGDWGSIVNKAQSTFGSNALDRVSAAYGMTPDQGAKFLASKGVDMGPGYVPQNPTQAQGQGPQAQQSSWGGNPYLQSMWDSLSRQTNRNLGRQMQGIQSNAIGVGGLGGSRQGVAQGLAIEGANNSLTDAMARMAYGDYDATQNRSLQKYGMDQNFTLGLGGLANQSRGIDNSYTLGLGSLSNQYDANRNQFFTQNRALDDQDRRTGMAMWGIGDQAQWDPAKSANSIYSSYSPYGSTTNSTSSGGGWLGALGGGLGAGQLSKNMGWWGN